MDLSLFLGGVCLGSLFASLNSASTLEADVCITNVSRTKKWVYHLVKTPIAAALESDLGSLAVPVSFGAS